MFGFLLWLGGGSAFAAVVLPSVTLAWDPSPDPTVAGYRMYVGTASQTYTNTLDLGLVTTGVVPNLAPATRYFFAVTAYTFSGLESALSAEISYVVPPGTAPARLSLSPSSDGQVLLTGAALPGEVFDLLVSGDLAAWSTLGSVTAGLDGSFQFIDLGASTNRARFYRLQQVGP